MRTLWIRRTAAATALASMSVLAAATPSASAREYTFDLGVAASRQPQPQWALAAIDARAAWQHTRGTGVTVAIVDSGVGRTHETRGQVTTGIDLFAGRTHRTIDRAHHGTPIASLVAGNPDGRGITGVAPAVDLLDVRVAGRWHAPSRLVPRGIRWAVDHGADVVNVSLAGKDRPRLRAAIRHAHRNGVVVVAGVGNEGEYGNTPAYPAAYPQVVAVAAVDRARGTAGYSTRGPMVDVAAPGTRVLAADPGSTLSYYTGTSFATPHVTGVVALMLSAHPDLSPAQVHRLLRRTAADLGRPGWDPGTGAGLVAAEAAVAAARRLRHCAPSPTRSRCGARPTRGEAAPSPSGTDGT